MIVCYNENIDIKLAWFYEKCLSYAILTGLQ